MGKIIPRGRAKLVAGLISGDRATIDKAVSYLIRRFGPVDGESRVFSFHHTPYYNEEMGAGLMRRFVSFSRLVRLEAIHRTKIYTNALERKMARAGKRTVNIDPGYLTLSNLVLLTTKDYTHRIYLRRGIYAETTLFYKDGSYRPWEWTYPDYKTEDYIAFFNSVREIFETGLKKRGR